MGPSWEPKPTQNRSRNGVQDGWHLGIDFWTILVHFGRQVGVEHRPKIDSNKNIENMVQNKSRFERVLEPSWADFGVPKKILRDFRAHYVPSVFALKISFVFDNIFGRPKTPQDAPQTPPRRPKTPPRRAEASSRRGKKGGRAAVIPLGGGNPPPPVFRELGVLQIIKVPQH